MVSCSKNNNADTVKDNSITDIDKNTQNIYESVTSFAEVPTDVVKTTNTAETTNNISVTPIMTDQYILSYKDGLLYIDFYKGTESVVTIPNEYLGEQIHGLKTGAFASCFIIEEINFSEGITDIGSFSFHYCENLKEVVLPKSLKTIEENAFFHCEMLKTISIPDGVTKIADETFAECTSLKEVQLPASVTYISDTAFLDTPNVIIVAPAGSYAQTFAQEQNIPFKAQ